MAYVQSATDLPRKRFSRARAAPGSLATPSSAVITAAFVAGLALLLAAPAFMQLQADSFRDLYLGRWIVVHGFPHREAFAIANQGGLWVDQQWLADVFSYLTWRLGGYQFLAVVNAMAFASAYGLLAALMRRRGSSVAVAISFSSFAMVSAFTLVFIRAQMLVLPLFVAVLWICLRDSERSSFSRSALLIVPLLALWANLHGSAVLAAGLAAGYSLYRCGRMLFHRERASAAGYAGLVALIGLTLLATPYGPGVLHYYAEFLGNKAMGAADFEWDPPTFPTLGFFQFVVPLALVSSGVLISFLRGRRPSMLLVAGVAVTATAAGIAMRNNVWLGILAALLLAETAGTWIPTRRYSVTFMRAVGVLAVVSAATGIGRLAFESSQRFEILAPQRAIRSAATYARSHPCAKVLADIVTVSALLWHEPWLAGRVGYDGRIEVYKPRALMDWVDFQAAIGSRPLATARGYTILMASSRSPRLMRELTDLSGSTVLDRDSTGITVLRDPARNAACPPH
jgi:hypothetical protein